MNQSKTDLGIVNESQFLRFGIRPYIVLSGISTFPENGKGLRLPLLLALFGHRGGICSGQLFENHNAQTRDFYISRVMSGGVSVNEAILQDTQYDMPFGGGGASGMGHYHGASSSITSQTASGVSARPNIGSATLSAATLHQIFATCDRFHDLDEELSETESPKRRCLRHS